MTHKSIHKSIETMAWFSNMYDSYWKMMIFKDDNIEDEVDEADFIWSEKVICNKSCTKTMTCKAIWVVMIDSI